jgi:hypothetical protein
MAHATGSLISTLRISLALIQIGDVLPVLTLLVSFRAVIGLFLVFFFFRFFVVVVFTGEVVFLLDSFELSC